MIEELWDGLSDQPGNVPLTDAQRQELDQRLDDLECSGPKDIPWEEKSWSRFGPALGEATNLPPSSRFSRSLIGPTQLRVTHESR
jgi:putative addiction module component (TIGR02574 family)